MATIHRLTNVDLPYDESRDPIWAAAVDGLPWVRLRDDTATKQGSCPRCGHTITFVEECRPAAPGEDADDGEDQGMYEECNCNVRHPGTPEGRIGCGANGLIRRAERPAQRWQRGHQ
jgi:hypothetical protein